MAAEARHPGEGGSDMILTVLAIAQQATVGGVVRDIATLEPVAFASVVVSSDSVSVKGAADRYGAFAMPDAPAGPVRIEASAFGYAPWVREYAQPPDRPIRVLMQPAPSTLDALFFRAPASSVLTGHVPSTT